MSQLKLVTAERKRARLRIGISSLSGGGKTFSSLLLAHGLVGDWARIAVIDTEQGSASLYSHLGPFLTIELNAPYAPERYVEAIHLCEQAEMECIIIDSSTHEWSGAGGALAIHEQLGGKFTDWARVTPRHRAFLDAMLQSKAHIICTTRKKTEWAVETNSRGKVEGRKVGLADEQRQGLDYEMTTAFSLNHHHLATCEKDRTGLFMGKPEFVLSAETGVMLRQWCESGAEPVEMYEPEKHRAALQALFRSHLSVDETYILTVVQKSALMQLDKSLRGQPVAKMEQHVVEMLTTPVGGLAT